MYTGLANQTVDTAADLLPYTQYDYRVTVYNSVGYVNSEWEMVLTKEAPPEGVPQPVVKVSTGLVEVKRSRSRYCISKSRVQKQV